MTSEQHLLQADQQARCDALDVSRSFIVQAPAGAGKTELLIQRYLKLLAVVDNPEEVIAITFTRKAAAEMQFRVLGALQMALCVQPSLEEHQQLTRSLAEAALRRDSECGWQLLANPRRMRIQTLDSLQAFIARSRPVLSPEGARGSRVVVDAELRNLHRAAALATLDWLVESGPAQDATREVLVHVDTNTGLYVAYLSQMLASRDQWLPFIGSGHISSSEALQLRSRFERNLAMAVSSHLQRTTDAFGASAARELPALCAYAATNLAASDGAASCLVDLLEIKALPGPDTGRLGQWIALAELLLTKGGTFRKTVDKRQGFPAKDDGQKAAMKSLLTSLSADAELAELLHTARGLPAVQYTDEQWRVLLALFRLLPLAVIELKRLFAEQGATDHIEVAMIAGAVLGTADDPGDMALLLDYQIRHLLIDEMQDTSLAQYRMLEALTGGWQPGDGRTMYCVGDPMQSIYRFRNAEVGQFLLAQQHGIGGIPLAPLVLRRNFRSGEFLVDWFNRVFPDIFSSDNDPVGGAVAYAAAASVPGLSGQGECFVHPVFGGNKQQEAATACQVIVTNLAAHPDDDMAVLVRSRTQLPSLLAALREAGVPYRAVEIDRLTDLPEVIEVLALTRAAVHQGDRLAWLAILRAPWIGLDWTDLHALVVAAANSTVWELLQDDGRLAGLSQRGRDAIATAMPTLRALTSPRRSTSLRDVVEQAWLALGGAAILESAYAVNNVYRFFDVLEAHERCGSLDDVAELEAMLDLERVSSDTKARLQIMTMHRAKGLQFPHVLLYGLGRVSGRSDARVLSWFDLPNEEGEERKIISPVGPRADIEKDALHQFIAQTEKGKDRHEQVRLLYVACTRAQKTLHLVGHVGVSTKEETCRPPLRNSLLHMLWPAVAPDYAAAFDTAVHAETGEDTDVWLQPVLRRFSAPWELPAVVDLPRYTGPEEGGVDNQEVEFYWVGNEARIAGTIVHRWLHLMAAGRATTDLGALPGLRSVTRRWLQELGIADEMNTAIGARVEDALQKMLADARGRWILSAEGRAELALTGVLDGQLETVILDRVLIDEDGQHWIVDYKTSSHEGGNLDGFLQAESERYQPQLQKYATLYNAYADTTARCALYFPLLQTFVEL